MVLSQVWQCQEGSYSTQQRIWILFKLKWEAVEDFKYENDMICVMF